MWRVMYLASNGWHVFRTYTCYYSALRWAEYNRECKNWKVVQITKQ